MFDSLKSGAMTILGGLVVVLSVLLFTSWGRVELAQSRLATEKSEHQRTRDAIAAQKLEAANLLRSANASVLATQNRLDASQLERAKSDATNGGVVAGLRADLLRLRESRRVQFLAEAGRRGDGGSAQQGAAGAAAGIGGQDGAAAGRVLSIAAPGARDFDAEADDDAFAADTINVAYASCRADAIALRQAFTP